MSNNIDLKNLWKQQSVDQPDIAELFEKLKQYKIRQRNKVILSNIILLSTSTFIGLIWYYFQPQFISTKIGIILVILAMLVYLAAYNKLLVSYLKVDQAQNNQDYIQKLMQIRSRQQFMSTVMLSIYFIILSIGICMYMYEYAIRMKLVWGIFTYALTISWILFNWFYTRPRQNKKDETKVNELIQKFEQLNNQMIED